MLLPKEMADCVEAFKVSSCNRPVEETLLHF